MTKVSLDPNYRPPLAKTDATTLLEDCPTTRLFDTDST